MVLNQGNWVVPNRGNSAVGEVCHFMDLLRLADSPIWRTRAVMIDEAPGIRIRDDKATIILEFGDGSFGSIHYLDNGHRAREHRATHYPDRGHQCDGWKRPSADRRRSLSGAGRSRQGRSETSAVGRPCSRANRGAFGMRLRPPPANNCVACFMQKASDCGGHTCNQSTLNTLRLQCVH